MAARRDRSFDRFRESIQMRGRSFRRWPLRSRLYCGIWRAKRNSFTQGCFSPLESRDYVKSRNGARRMRDAQGATFAGSRIGKHCRVRAFAPGWSTARVWEARDLPRKPGEWSPRDSQDRQRAMIRRRAACDRWHKTGAGAKGISTAISNFRYIKRDKHIPKRGHSC